MIRKIQILLEMIKFRHTAFAMPFALMGMLLAQGSMPEGRIFIWVVIALVGSRTCAMGFNRIVDARFDAENPRTTNRAIPSGRVRIWEAVIMVLLSGLLYFWASYRLNHLAFILSPLALGLTLLYSFTKRFTWLCHLFLGFALASAPIGGYVAVQGDLAGAPWFLSTGVLFWVAGFDTVYACLDTDFDKRAGLYSFPARFDNAKALRFAVAFHIIAYAFFAANGLSRELNSIYFAGLVVSGGILFYQHYFFTYGNFELRQISDKFMSLNGLVSITILFCTWFALL